MHRIINIIAQCTTVMNAELIRHHVTLVAIQITLYFTLGGFQHFACISFTVADDTTNKDFF